VDPKPAKIFERPAEPPAKSTVEELRETVAEIPAKRGKGRPKTGQAKPWVSLGMTKSTYYVKKSKGEVWWLRFRIGEYLRVRLRKSLRLRIHLLGRVRLGRLSLLLGVPKR
jgi:hypothetical protein